MYFGESNSVRPCATCAYFGGWRDGGRHAWCLHGRIVMVDPRRGCGYWMRETGADDEDAAPTGAA